MHPAGGTDFVLDLLFFKEMLDGNFFISPLSHR